LTDSSTREALRPLLLLLLCVPLVWIRNDNVVGFVSPTGCKVVHHVGGNNNLVSWCYTIMMDVSLAFSSVSAGVEGNGQLPVPMGCRLPIFRVAHAAAFGKNCEEQTLVLVWPPNFSVAANA
jgi:hypothetical protein